MTGVSVMPISGEIWLQPWLSLGVFAGPQGSHTPGLPAGVRVEGIGAAMFGHHKQGVLRMKLAWEAVGVEWLSVDLSIHREGTDFPKVEELTLEGVSTDSRVFCP